MWVAEVVSTPIAAVLETSGNRAGFLMFAAFLLSFGFIRLSTRLMRSPKVPWWPGSVTPGGLHIHHLVFGIVMMLIGGFVSIGFQPDSPGIEIVAVVFGIGAGLTLDEFALWLHLDDVYWSDEGRQSIDAVVLAALLAATVLIAGTPLAGDSGAGVLSIVATVVLVILYSLLSALKGKYFFAILGLVLPFFSFIGSIRLAKPNSPWARRRYKDGSRKLERATRRCERSDARRLKWLDRIGGAPDKPSPRKLEP